MHELSIAMSILEMAEQEAAARNAALEAIHVRVGALSGVVSQALLSAFDLAREASPLRSVRLQIEEVPVRIHCRTCGADRPVPSMQRLCCAECGTPGADIVQGRELQVVGLELRDE
jgi:hydrogenase nickel incorporation protein HypA/HybF